MVSLWHGVGKGWRTSIGNYIIMTPNTRSEFSLNMLLLFSSYRALWLTLTIVTEAQMPPILRICWHSIRLSAGGLHQPHTMD